MERRRPVQQQPKAKTFSYYNNPAKPSMEKPADSGKRAAGKLRMLPTYLAILVIAGAVLYSLTLSSRPSVELLSGQAPIYRTLEDYTVATQEILESKLTSKTKLTADTRHVERELMERYPEIRTVVLRLPVIGRRPSLVIDISYPEMILATTTKVFALDYTGKAIGEAGKIPSDVKKNMPVLHDQSGLDPELGKQAVTSDTVSFVTGVLAQLKDKKIKVDELILPTVANELDIRIKGAKYVIKTDTSGDPRLQIGSWLAVRDRINPKEYVDVRVEEKVFYK